MDAATGITGQTDPPLPLTPPNAALHSDIHPPGDGEAKMIP